MAGLLGLAGELPEPELPLVLEVDGELPAAADTQFRSGCTGMQAALRAVDPLPRLVCNCYHKSAARARPSTLMLGAATLTDLTPQQAMTTGPVHEVSPPVEVLLQSRARAA